MKKQSRNLQTSLKQISLFDVGAVMKRSSSETQTAESTGECSSVKSTEDSLSNHFTELFEGLKQLPSKGLRQKTIKSKVIDTHDRTLKEIVEDQINGIPKQKEVIAFTFFSVIHSTR